MIFDEETMGITDEDRAYHLHWHYCGSFLLTLMCAFLGYSIYLAKTDECELKNKAFVKIEIFYIAFEVIFALRLMIRLYLIF